MTLDSLLRAAEAAGFATASDENARTSRRAEPVAPAAPAKTAKPRDVLTFSSAAKGGTASLQQPMGHWARAQFAGLLPVWYAKG
jgi:hypothetical protein